VKNSCAHVIKKYFVIVFIVLTVGLNPSAARSARLPLELIQLPDGFKIEVYAQNIENARAMSLSPQGTLFVGSRSAGNVYAVVDTNKDFKADEVFVIAQGLKMPVGVAFRDGDLYVAEVHRVIKFVDIERNLSHPGDPVVVNDEFPNKRHHGWKFIRFGPDGKLYVPVGAPCNVCERDNPIFSTITRMNADGSDLEVFAQGIRNSVGFDWDPQTQELWFTDNGRDMLGDNIPPDELNHAPQAGMHFGFPYCHGGDIPDPKFGKKRSCNEFNPPAQNLGPHVASLGMRFYTGTLFPEMYRNNIFIAEHGSWNRSQKIGYRIAFVPVDNNKASGYAVFAHGWKQGENVWGRPVDIQEMPDGSMLVSDDFAHVIYRISYEGP